MTREFVSYASEYDLYVGTRDWNQISCEEQDEIIEAMTSPNGDPMPLVMSSGLKRRQEEGLRAITVFTSMMLEKSETIRATDWGSTHRLWLRSVLAQTPVGARLWEAWERDENEESRTPLSAEMLERLAQHGMLESPLGELPQMDWHEAEALLRESIGTLPELACEPEQDGCMEMSDDHSDAARTRTALLIGVEGGVCMSDFVGTVGWLIFMAMMPVTYVIGIIHTWSSGGSTLWKIFMSVSFDVFMAVIWPGTWVVWIVKHLAGGWTPLQSVFGL